MFVVVCFCLCITVRNWMLSNRSLQDTVRSHQFPHSGEVGQLPWLLHRRRTTKTHSPCWTQSCPSLHGTWLFLIVHVLSFPPCGSKYKNVWLAVNTAHYYRGNVVIVAWLVGSTVPFLAWYDPNLLTLPMGCNQPCLPPLIIGGIDDMQDVPIGETQALAREATVPGPVVVKKSPGKIKWNKSYINSVLEEWTFRLHCQKSVVFE